MSGGISVSFTGLCPEVDLTEWSQLSPGGFPFLLLLRADSLRGVMVSSACQLAECRDDSINLHLNP